MSEAGGLRGAVEALAAQWQEQAALNERAGHFPWAMWQNRSNDLRALLAAHPAPEVDPTAGERGCRCPCHETSVNGVLPAHSGPCSCTVMSPAAVGLLNEVRDGDTTRLHAMFDADPLPATPDADDASERRLTDRERRALSVAAGAVARAADRDASTSAGEGLSEAERLLLDSPLQGFGASLCGPEPVYVAVERIVAAREAAAATKARAEAGEQIAQAIEAAGRRRPRDPQWMWAVDAAVAARIAREVTR